MQFLQIDPQRYSDAIREGRRDLLRAWGVTEGSTDAGLYSRLIDVLPNATYFGMSPTGSDELAGFTESYFYASLSRGFESVPFAHLFPLATIAPPERMANIRTAYLKREHRRKFGLYVKLYVTTALHFLGLGASHTTLTTWAEAGDLHALYRRMGGRSLCTFALAGCPIRLEAFLIDLRQLVAQPFVARFAAAFPDAG